MSETPLTDNVADKSDKFDDPDAGNLDDLVEQEAEPPSADEYPVSPPNAPVAHVPPMGNRSLKTATTNLGATWDASRMMTADSDRVELHLYCTSDTPTDFVLFGDDSSKFAGEMSAGILYSGQEITLTDYQGPIWVAPGTGITGPVKVTALAITK